MAFTNAAHWWQEWQMRILVLGSVLFHMTLFFADVVRRSPKLRWFRFLVQWAYVGGDALAVYALATLLNRHKHGLARGSRGRSDLELLWAPVLLLHLGGQPTLSAYSLEDNEQWMQHAVILVSKVTVALYVFYNWWSGDRQLLNVAVLLFVVGIIRFIYKPWALRQASLSSLGNQVQERASDLLIKRRIEREGWIGWCWRCCTTYLMENISPDKLEAGQDVTRYPLREFVRSARQHLDMAEQSENVPPVSSFLYKRDVFTPVSFLYKMFVNVPRQDSDRLQEFKFFLLLSDSDSYKLLQKCLYNIFQILYTRRRVTHTWLVTCLQLLLPFLTLTSVVLFATSHKAGYDVNDVWVTYILFCFTAMDEFFPFVPFFPMFRGNWHEMVSQGSLISFCACQEATTAKFIRPYLLREYVIKHWHVKQEPAAKDITDRVRKHVKDGWKSYIYGPISYREFNDLRGQWTLKKYKHKMDTTHHDVLALSSTVPFDESVLMWHVATDFCYYKDKQVLTAAAQAQAAGGEEGSSCTRKETRHSAYLSRRISKYMVYLLFSRPEMLLPGARSGLFDIASDHIADILKPKEENRGVTNGNGPVINEAQGIAQRIYQDVDDVLLSPEYHGDKKFIHLLTEAKSMAEALSTLGVDDRWQLIDGVWVEMLCFSAARCSGHLHARSLGHGGEFLSYVWLLWSAMGLETFADKIIEDRTSHMEEEEAMREEEREVYVDHITEEISS